jgi:hypothetical protein
MITHESIMAISKSDITEAARTLSKDDISQLVDWLSLKDDKLRYQALLLLQSRSAYYNEVYTYWDIFREKLKSDNSYQRSIGIMLIAENARWDTQNLMEEAIYEYLKCLNDEKPITVRQCIQSLAKIIIYKPELSSIIADKLVELDLTDIKVTMRKLILIDILEVLLIIRKNLKSDKLEGYIASALSGDILDNKSKKQLGLEVQK